MIDSLINKIIEIQNPACVGLDTDFSYLPEEMRGDTATFGGAAQKIVEFNRNIIDSVCDVVPAVKVQVAYYEMYSCEGMNAFYQTIKYARAKGLTVIADCKRNDIGSTAGCYSKAYLGNTQVGGANLQAFPSDMLTVNGYLGYDGIKPFVEPRQVRFRACKNFQSVERRTAKSHARQRQIHL